MSRCVFITGASSGIGQALAREYAARGCDLALAARRTDALTELRSQILSRHGVRVHTYPLDITRYDDVFATLAAAAEDLGQLDVVIANAGVSGLGRVGHGHFARHRAVIETNVLGTMATCEAAMRLFRQQDHGHLVTISSVAAFRGLPGGGAYGASKAALNIYMQAVRAENFGTPIKVTTVFPGFIDTAINQSNPYRPFLIAPERGAKLIADRIDRGVAHAIVPRFPWALVKWLANWMPTALLAKRRNS